MGERTGIMGADMKPVETGTILKEYLVARNITQEQACEMIGTSTRHMSQVVNNKINFSEHLALKLERVFPDIKAEFWLDIEMVNRLYKLRRKG